MVYQLVPVLNENTKNEENEASKSKGKNKNKSNDVNNDKDNNNNAGIGFSDKWLDLEQFKGQFLYLKVYVSCIIYVHLTYNSVCFHISGWLVKSTDHQKAFCKVCNRDLTAHRTVLTKHMDSNLHKTNFRAVATNKDIRETVNSSLEKSTANAEIKLCAYIAKEDLPMLLANSLIPLCTKIFPDSKIATALKCKRTKTTEVINEVLGNLNYFIFVSSF